MKKKGKYVGGILPLGYRADSKNMKMLVDPAEAAIVRQIYDEYFRIGLPKEVQRIMEERGVRGREWVSRRGVRHGGEPLSRAVIRGILQNPLYIGKVRYRDTLCEGEHDGIIPVDLWEKVQSTFRAGKGGGRQSGQTLKPFAGLIRCGHCDAPMFVAAAVKPGGRRYDYYVCHVDEKRSHRQCPLHRVPAEPLEKLLLNQLTVLSVAKLTLQPIPEDWNAQRRLYGFPPR